MSSISTEIIGQFSTGVWNNLGQPTDITVTSISGWVTQPQTLGKLNSYIGTCFQGTGYTGANSWDYDVTPALTNTETAILDEMFQISYYQQLIRKIAGAGGVTRIIQGLSEGDSKISYVSSAALAKVYTENLVEANKRLNYAVNVYTNESAGANNPRSVDYYTLLPQGSRYYDNNVP